MSAIDDYYVALPHVGFNLGNPRDGDCVTVGRFLLRRMQQGTAP